MYKWKRIQTFEKNTEKSLISMKEQKVKMKLIFRVKDQEMLVMPKMILAKNSHIKDSKLIMTLQNGIKKNI